GSLAPPVRVLEQGVPGDYDGGPAGDPARRGARARVSAAAGGVRPAGRCIADEEGEHARGVSGRAQGMDLEGPEAQRLTGLDGPPARRSSRVLAPLRLPRQLALERARETSSSGHRFCSSATSHTWSK